jgi:hypothetical protein
VASPVSRVNPGERVTLEVVYQNTGSAAVYHAEARISAVDPFTSNDDTAYLGDLAPGQTGTALFEMTVDGGATPKSYGLDSEIRYRDALDNSQISDTIKVQVDVVQPKGILGTLSNPVVLSVILALVAIALYYILIHRRKK